MVFRMSGFDPKQAASFLEGKAGDDTELWRQAESAGKFLSAFGPRLPAFRARQSICGRNAACTTTT